MIMPTANRTRDVNAYSADTTVGEALAGLKRAFAEAGIEAPQQDARFLLEGLLGLEGSELLTRPERPLGVAAARVKQAALRRLADEPVSRILGRREFFGRTFIVTPDVLDP